MKAFYLLLASAGLAASASAQFTASSGAGDLIPAVGSTGGPGGWDAANLDHDLTLAVAPGVATINVPVAVTSIDSIVLDGLEHTWMGDTMAILRDPGGTGHVIWIRPEIEVGETCCGNSGDFVLGTFTFVEPGTTGSNGPLPETGNADPGMWDQSLDSNDAVNPVVWPTGDEMIFNTPLSGITGAAGAWTLSIYDFAGGDDGAFTDVTINGNGGGGGTGVPFCDPNEVNSTGMSTQLTGNFGTGVGSDLHLEATQGPASQFGYFLIGTGSSDPGFFPPSSAGRLCLAVGGTNAFGRYNFGTGNMNSLGLFDAAGVLQSSFGNSTTGSGYDVPSTIPVTGFTTVMSGDTWHFQLWHRENAGSSNFSNGLSVTFP